MNLEKLSPAPWEANGVFCNGPDGHAIFVAENIDAPGMAAINFSALARNAFEIMRQRFWFPRFCGTVDGQQRWIAYSWVGLRDVSEIYLKETVRVTGAMSWPDPFTALVEADKWFRENVENPS